MKKKTNVTKRVILIALLVLILAGIGVLGWFLYGRVAEDTSTPPNTRGRINLETVPETYVIENANLRLTLYSATTQFKLEELEDGKVKRTWFSNPCNVQDGSIDDGLEEVSKSESVRNIMRSTMIVSYSANSADKDLNNWEYSIDKQAYSIDQVSDTELEVHYTVGMIQGVSRIPLVLTGERWKELEAKFKEKAPEGTTKVKWAAFTGNYTGKTIHDLALDESADNRELAAHLIETRIADDVMNSEKYMWVQETITALNEASIPAYDQEATLAAIDAHAEELGEETANELRTLAAGSEEDHRSAILILQAYAAENTAEETEGEEDAEEAQSEAWTDSLIALLDRPVRDPFDGQAMADSLKAHKEGDGASFFTDEDWYDSLVGLITCDPEIMEQEQLQSPEDAYKLAAERMSERATTVAMELEENAWARNLVDVINTANAAETFDAATVRESLEAAEEDPDHAKLLKTDKYYVAGFLRVAAKENITLGLEGGSAGSTIYAGIGYSEEDYLMDSKWQLPAEEDTTIAFNITIRYKLEGPDLVVEVPYGEIRYNKAATITYVTVLPMFGAAGKNADGVYDNGFIFVPEGGGALIRFNNGKMQQNNYTANVYGWDYASKRGEAVSETKATFPVFGMTYGKHKQVKGTGNDNTRDAADKGSFICIIEEGASYAAIQADINGQPGIRSAFHPNSFNTVSAKYHVLHSDQYNVSAKTANMVLMYENDLPAESIVQRYRFIDSDNYVDMANVYGAYLREKHPDSLTDTNLSGDLPVMVEMVGAIDKKVVVAGLPVNKTIPITTFSQAESIMSSLTAGGVRSLNIRYTGWANGGVRQKVLTGVHVEGILGGEGGMKNLIARAQEAGVPLYFDGVTVFAYRSGMTDGFIATSHAARYTTREVVELTPFSKIYYTPDDEQDSYYLVQPAYAAEKAGNLIRFLKDKGAYGVAFRDIGYVLSANYDRNNLTTREAAKAMHVKTLEQAGEAGRQVMIKEGYDYAMPYAAIITDMDLDGIPYSILDENVPFYQIAIHGTVNYTGKPLNMVSDWQTELLHCAEYGAGLSFTFIYENGSVLQDTLYSDYHAANWDGWKERAIQIATRYQADMAGLNQSRIVGHMTLPLGVKMTEYDNGTRVYVNYGTEDYTLADGTVVPARDYLVCTDSTEFQAVVEPNGAFDLVNYTAETYTAGSGKVYPRATTRIKSGEKVEVVFLDEETRIYVNADSEPITVADGRTVQPGGSLSVTDGAEFEAIFTSDGSALYVNYTDKPMLAGETTVPARNYVWVRNAAGLDAVVIEPAAAEPAEGEEPAAPQYRVAWVNFTDADADAAGETVPAKSVLWSGNESPVIVAFCPDGSRLYVNRTDAALNAGEKTVAAHNTLAVSDAQPLDIICLGNGGRIYVNSTDADILRSGAQTPAKGTVEAAGGDLVEVIFLPDGTRIYANYTDAVIRTGATNIAAGNYVLMTEAPALDTIVAELTAPAEEEGAEDVKQRVSMWVNGTDEPILINGVEIPAKGTVSILTGEAALEIAVLPDGTFRLIRHVGLPPQLQIAGATIQGATWADVEAIPEGTVTGFDGLVLLWNLTGADVTIDGFTVPAGGFETNQEDAAEEDPVPDQPAEETAAPAEETPKEGGDE